MTPGVQKNEIFGLVHPSIDVHTLGITYAAKLLESCGYKVFIGGASVSDAIANLDKLDSFSLLRQWVLKNKISRLGFSYRLEPLDAQFNFGKLYNLLKTNNLFKEQGGSLLQIYFAGLPEACQRIKLEYQNNIPVFMGDESLLETALIFGIPVTSIPNSITNGSKYDEERMLFAKKVIDSESYIFLQPNPRPNYQNFGTRNDTLVERIASNRKPGFRPLMRVHAGPYNSDYTEAKKEFLSWLKSLSEAKFLDIVSVGTSQLSQSDFGQEWGDKPNGGGVPINSESDLVDIYDASRPMLVRTYAGTRSIPHLADIYERTINIAWHALSFWWFNQIDGRGPNTVYENLKEHIETLKYISSTSKPFEPNIPHHFSFRGADDYTYVLSSYLAVKTAKIYGIRYIVLQVMLNTPKYTWGVQDLAKSMALLKLVRELEDDNFKVFLQPRAGLDFFSPDLDKAKVQLASVSAMMDDIEPNNNFSPDIVHVVSYCEAVKLATPTFINESIKITTESIIEYRRQKKLGLIDNIAYNAEVQERTADIYHNVINIVYEIEKNITDAYSANGLYTIFKKGIMPAPYLWECRDEFSEVVKWNTDLVHGSIKVVNELGIPIDPIERVKSIFDNK